MVHKLYGSRTSLYSGKVRAYLDWKNVDYEEVLATADIHKELIIPSVGRSVIPVLETKSGEIIQDSTRIIDHFESTQAGPSVYPDSPRQKLVALLFEVYGDEWLVIPAMHYRWNYNEDWVYGEFGATAAPDSSPEEQLAIGQERGAFFKGFCPVLGIDETTIPAIEASYEALLADLDAHFSNYEYLLGSRPSIGDYGLTGPFYAHLYRDPASGEIMKRLAPNVAKWVERMVEVDIPLSGSFLPDDDIPETLVPILERMMSEQMPFLQATAIAVKTWVQENPNTEFPRAVGMANFTIEGVVGQRIATPFSLWMLQRPLNNYENLNPSDKLAVDQLLGAVKGAEAFKSFTLGFRLKFEEFEIRIA